MPPTVRLTAQVFGRERAGVAFGWIFAAHMVGASVAAYGAGYSRSVLQTYLPALLRRRRAVPRRRLAGLADRKAPRGGRGGGARAGVKS